MDTRDPLKYYSTLCVDILSIMSLSPAWTARPSGALSGQPSAPSVSVPCHSNTIMLHYTKQQSRPMEPGACTIYFLFCLLLSACSRKTLYLRTVVIQLHRHQSLGAVIMMEIVLLSFSSINFIHSFIINYCQKKSSMHAFPIGLRGGGSMLIQSLSYLHRDLNPKGDKTR